MVFSCAAMLVVPFVIKDSEEATRSVAAFVQELRSQISDINRKLERLLETYLEQDIERDVYREEKAKLLSSKKSLTEQIARLEQKQNAWLEHFRNWLKDAQNLNETSLTPTLSLKKTSAQKIFGSNISLRNREIEFTPVPHYAALRAAREKIGRIEENLILVPP